MSHLDEAREGEERVPFAERLVPLQDQGQDGELTVVREDLHVLQHRALHVAVGLADDDLIRGADSWTAFFRRLAAWPRSGGRSLTRCGTTSTLPSKSGRVTPTLTRRLSILEDSGQRAMRDASETKDLQSQSRAIRARSIVVTPMRGAAGC